MRRGLLVVMQVEYESYNSGYVFKNTTSSVNKHKNVKGVDKHHSASVFKNTREHSKFSSMDMMSAVENT